MHITSNVDYDHTHVVVMNYFICVFIRLVFLDTQKQIVRLYLPKTVFLQGHFSMDLSRFKKYDNIFILVPEDKTQNIV